MCRRRSAPTRRLRRVQYYGGTSDPGTLVPEVTSDPQYIYAPRRPERGHGRACAAVTAPGQVADAGARDALERSSQALGGPRTALWRFRLAEWESTIDPDSRA